MAGRMAKFLRVSTEPSFRNFSPIAVDLRLFSTPHLPCTGMRIAILLLLLLIVFII
jgi:hypothetical protein